MAGSPSNEPQNIRQVYRKNSDRIPHGLRAFKSDESELLEIYQTSNALWVYVRGGMIDVTVDQPNNAIYNEQTIATGVTDTLLTYNIPANETGRIISVEGYGQAGGEFAVQLGASVIGRFANSYMSPSVGYDLRGTTYADTDSTITVSCRSYSFE